MKAFKYLVLTAAGAALLGITNVRAEQLKSVTVQYGQGIAVTYFEPVAPKATNEQVHALKQAKESVAVDWKQQSVPNGSPVSYVDHEQTNVQIAPMK